MVCALSGNLIRESERQTAAVAARSAALLVQLQKLTFGILTPTRRNQFSADRKRGRARAVSQSQRRGSRLSLAP